MKPTRFLLIVLVLVLAGCSTARPPAEWTKQPETVLVTYHVQSGKEAEFQALLARSWELYRHEHLVFARPHLIVRDMESDGKPRFTEIFTWASRATPEHAPDGVKQAWQEEQALCEERNGHYAIEPGEVSLITPR